MLPIFAHIAGIPVEETALSFAPIIAVAGGVAGLRLRAQRSWRLVRAGSNRRGEGKAR